MGPAKAKVVSLLDVDNTLIDNDRITADLHRYLSRELGEARAAHYFELFEEHRKSLGYADYLGALQHYRLCYPRDPHVLAAASFLVDYPFANRLYPRSLDVIEHLSAFGPTVILSDGDVVFQPRKVERSGLFEAVDKRVLIYVHKERELDDVLARFPAEHYLLVDDKIRILTAIKRQWGTRLTTVFPRQGHYALAPEVGDFPEPDVRLERIDELLNYDLGALLAAAQSSKSARAGLLAQRSVCEDPPALIARAAQLVVDAAHDAIGARGQFLFCLSGGHTPRALYEKLASPEWSRRVDWSRTHVFFGDERCVPPDHEQSNYRMANEALLSRVPIPAAQVKRMRGEGDPPLMAAEYERVLRDELGVSAYGAPERPFDLLLLGMGADGHTASLFPGSEIDREHWVAARTAPNGSLRISLTEIVLNAAERTLFLVEGQEKAARLAQVLQGPEKQRELPTQRIRPCGQLIFLIDRAAASRLS